MNRTKIVATFGPACDNEAVFAAMLRAGLDVVRLNVSHLDPKDLAATVARVRKWAARAKLPLAVLADMPGPKIRCTICEPSSFEVHPGQSIAVAPGNAVSTPERVHIAYRHLLDDVAAGHELAINDGLVLLRVERVDREAGCLQCSVVRGGPIASRKGVSFLHSTLRITGLTARDRQGILAAAENDVDFIALSFVRSVNDVLAARRILAKTAQPGLPLIAKIEQREAIANIEEILAEADGVMVARGDMGIEQPLEQVPLLQKDIIRAANRAGKAVITATQMLESMIENTRPTRAEVSDVANAMLDGTDAVMLSAETAMGCDPAEVVETMTRIAAAAEGRFDSRQWLHRMEVVTDDTDNDLDDALARATCQLALDAALDAIVCLTYHGTTARRISRYRPACPVFALSPHPEQCRRAGLVWGVEAVEFPQGAVTRARGKDRPVSELLKAAIKQLRAQGHLKSGARVAFLAGVPLQVPGGTNYLRVVEVF
jgi:pyruvate kinase